MSPYYVEIKKRKKREAKAFVKMIKKIIDKLNPLIRESHGEYFFSAGAADVFTDEGNRFRFTIRFRPHIYTDNDPCPYIENDPSYPIGVINSDGEFHASRGLNHIDIHLINKILKGWMK